MESLREMVLEHKAELERLRDRSPKAVTRNRANILLAWASGLSQAAVGRALDHARSTVRLTLQRFRDQGLDGVHDGRKGSVRIPNRAEVVERLPDVVRKQPQDFGWQRSTWSAELAALQIAAELGVCISRPHMGRLLHEAGCRRVRPKPTVALAPPDKAEQLAKLKAELDAVPADEVVLFEDECDLHLNPKVGPDWTPAGERKTVVTPGRNAKYYLAGAYAPRQRELTVMCHPRKNSDLFTLLVQDVMLRYADRRRVHLVLDNFSIHHSKKTARALAAYGDRLVLHFLPPYSPEGNAIERLWLDLHTSVTRNHRHADLFGLVDDALRYLDHYDGRGPSAAGRLRAAVEA